MRKPAITEVTRLLLRQITRQFSNVIQEILSPGSIWAAGPPLGIFKTGGDFNKAFFISSGISGTEPFHSGVMPNRLG